MSGLKSLDLSENSIDELPAEIGNLLDIEQLSVRQNKLRRLPLLERCCKLKDLDVSFNQLESLDAGFFESLLSVVNLNLRDNKLVALPATIRSLNKLTRLDLSNNNLSGQEPDHTTLHSLYC